MGKQINNIKGMIRVGDREFEVRYRDNPTSLSFLDQMPFTVVLEDYAGNEKIFYPEAELNRRGAPEGATPITGDMMCYSPWGNVAIFYKDAPFASGLIPMGRVSDVSGLLRALDLFQATAEFQKE